MFLFCQQVMNETCFICIDYIIQEFLEVALISNNSVFQNLLLYFPTYDPVHSMLFEMICEPFDSTQLLMLNWVTIISAFSLKTVPLIGTARLHFCWNHSIDTFSVFSCGKWSYFHDLCCFFLTCLNCLQQCCFVSMMELSKETDTSNCYTVCFSLCLDFISYIIFSCIKKHSSDHVVIVHYSSQALMTPKLWHIDAKKDLCCLCKQVTCMQCDQWGEIVFRKIVIHFHSFLGSLSGTPLWNYQKSWILLAGKYYKRKQYKGVSLYMFTFWNVTGNYIFPWLEKA
jgi:hypothetical protein